MLVFNNTRVVPARLFGHKETGGAIEILVERVLSGGRVLAQVRSSKSPKPGSQIYLEDKTPVQVEGRQDAFFVLGMDEPWAEVMERIGHMPLPPYIDRDDQRIDRERYQTVFATQLGAVAAPTAGLHFDSALLGALQDAGIESAEITLHIGAGTYQPVRAARVEDHQMHSEWIDVRQGSIDTISAAKARGSRIVAVGTTAMRSLETAAKASPSGEYHPYCGDTDIFIYPGFEFRCVDALITNFHLPQSSLLMLVSAFGGYQRIRNAYQQAIDERYRFFSYGDAMFITAHPEAIAR